MARHNETGKEGEELAVQYLLEHGYSIIHRNWRYLKFEIDVICEKGGLLRFVEVKMRTNESELPEDKVTPKKIEFLLRAVEAYLDQHPKHRDFRLDVLAITSVQGGEPEYFLIEDVYL
jgi:putative endonuclease